MKRIQILVTAGENPLRAVRNLCTDDLHDLAIRLEKLEGRLKYFTQMRKFDEGAECYQQALELVAEHKFWSRTALNRKAVPLMLAWGKWEQAEELIIAVSNTYRYQPCYSFYQQLLDRG